MKYFYLLLSLILFTPYISVAQSNYKPGYVVTLNGDTLKGYIDYRKWNRNPKEFNFTDNLNNSQTKSFSTTDVSSFTITGYEHYKRFILKISQDRVDGFKVSTQLNTKQINDTVFLKVINSGKYITLYSYNDQIKNRYFIDENNNQPFELVWHVYINPDSPPEIKRIDTYKRQLQGLAVKYQTQYQTLIQEIQEANYDGAELEKIVFEINGSDKASTFTSSKNYGSRLFLGLGINKIFVHNFTTDNSFESHKNSGYNAQPAIAEEINLGEDLFLNRTEKSLILRTELNYTFGANNKLTGKGTDSLFFKYNRNVITVNPQLLYNIYNNSHLKIYISGGLEVFVRTGGKFTYVANSYDGVDFNPPIYYTATFSLTTSAEFIVDNKFDFYAGYDPPSAIGQKINTLSSFRAGINYLFGKKSSY
jgi:hypothetical protein